MTVKINHETVSLPEGLTTLGETLRWKGVPDGGTAVALNGRLVPRSRWDATALDQNDDIVVISAAFGG